MNRSILTVAGIGLVGCVALMMMMGQLLKVHGGEKGQEPAVKGFRDLFASSLSEEPVLKIRRIRGQPFAVSVEARVKPKVTTDIRDSLQVMGRYLWAQVFKMGRPRQVVITWTDPVRGSLHRRELRRPKRKGVQVLTGAATGGPASQGSPHAGATSGAGKGGKTQKSGKSSTTDAKKAKKRAAEPGR